MALCCPAFRFVVGVLVTARRAREGVLLGERARRWGGPPGLAGGASKETAVAATREGAAEERTPGGTSAYASGSEEDPLAGQPRGVRDEHEPRGVRVEHDLRDHALAKAVLARAS